MELKGILFCRFFGFQVSDLCTMMDTRRAVEYLCYGKREVCFQYWPGLGAALVCPC